MKKNIKNKTITTVKKYKKNKHTNRAKLKKQKKQGGGACFTEDTLILTEDGLVEIDEIEVGDFVWSENPETGDITLKEVKETFVNKTDTLVCITVNNETIKTTEGHLFYVEDIGWLPASMLKKDDILSLEDGRELPIQSIRQVTYNYYINVYNFEVEDYHTYYVSDDSVLVHNMCAARTVKGFPLNVHAGKQGKHIKGHNNYTNEKKGFFYGNIDDAQVLVNKYAGTGEWLGENKERIKTNKVIGMHIDFDGNRRETTNFIIHYSKTGTHIVPAAPN